MKVVLDSNVVVSSLMSVNGSPWRVVGLLRQQTFDLVLSEEILLEYARTMNYEKVRRYHNLNSTEINQFLSELKSIALFVAAVEPIHAVDADPMDNKFIEAAVAGDADFIVSGDKHLLDLGEFDDIRIVTPAMFVAYMEQIG